MLDTFCGCGTAVAATQKLGRRWTGIVITRLAVSLIHTRLVDHFGKTIGDGIEVIGEPEDLVAAQTLFDANPFQFEWWALSLVRAMPSNDYKRGADRGVDGVVYFHVDNSGKPQKVIVQVNGGKVQASVVRDLRGTMSCENAAMALLVTLQPPTPAMRQEAASAGVYQTLLGATFPSDPDPDRRRLVGGQGTAPAARSGNVQEGESHLPQSATCVGPRQCLGLPSCHITYCRQTKTEEWNLTRDFVRSLSNLALINSRYHRR